MKRLVLKVGSAVLTEQYRIARQRMQNLVDFIVELRNMYEVILVSSGAVAAGYTKLKIDKKNIANKQALAAIGQPLLMRLYKKKLEKYHVLPAQVLVTAANFETAEQSDRVRNTVEPLLRHGVIPIVNENDATATQELELGDNDQLSAYTAVAFNADMLVILSDIDAYYDKDPNQHADAHIKLHVNAINSDELSKKMTPNNSFATGGIVTKLKAAAYMLEHHKTMYLASGFDLHDAREFLLHHNHTGGTLFSRGNA